MKKVKQQRLSSNQDADVVSTKKKSKKIWSFDIVGLHSQIYIISFWHPDPPPPPPPPHPPPPITITWWWSGCSAKNNSMHTMCVGAAGWYK